jgi:hypothetical protein
LAAAVAAGDLVLASIAAPTTRIHLGSAVTVLSSDDPARVFQRYSTLNAVSGGRAEVILVRGSSIDSFPLFGYDLADYEDLFEAKTNHGGFPLPLRGDRSVLKAFSLRHSVTVVWSRRADTEANVPP